MYGCDDFNTPKTKIQLITSFAKKEKTELVRCDVSYVSPRNRNNVGWAFNEDCARLFIEHIVCERHFKP